METWEVDPGISRLHTSGGNEVAWSLCACSAYRAEMTISQLSLLAQTSLLVNVSRKPRFTGLPVRSSSF